MRISVVLPQPLGPSQAKQRPARHVDRDVVHGELLPEPLRDMLELDDRVAHCAPRRGRIRALGSQMTPVTVEHALTRGRP